MSEAKLMDQAVSLASTEFTQNQNALLQQAANKLKASEIWGQRWNPVIHTMVKYSAGYLVIILIIVICGIWFFKKDKRPSPKPTPRTADKSGGGFLDIQNPYKNVDDFAIERPTIAVGRTDQVTYFDPTGSYDTDESSVAAKTSRPKPVVWNIDPTRIRGFQQLPGEIIKKIMKSPQLSITIPWKIDGYNWIPDCSAATYSDGTSAAKLLVDRGNTCQIATGTLTPYTPRMRPQKTTPGYSGLDKYATKENPRCS